MRSNGALRPHHGAAAAQASSAGVVKYRDKQRQRQWQWQCQSQSHASDCRQLEGARTSNTPNNSNNNQSQYNHGRLNPNRYWTIPPQALVQLAVPSMESRSRFGGTEQRPVRTRRHNEVGQSCANQLRHLLAIIVVWAMCAQQSFATMAMAGVSCMHRKPVGGPRRHTALLLMGFLCSTAMLPADVRCDDTNNFFGVNTFSEMPHTDSPIPAFDYASRGSKKFGDKCENTIECGFPGSICDPKKKYCQCTEDLPVTNHFDKCGKEAAVNESCFFNEQCEVKYYQTECRDSRCICRFEMTPVWGKDGSVECIGRKEKRDTETYIDPAMIGVLVGMALMFVIICVVLRLFSQARWRENRTIFNTPNPRLMNVSLLRESKLLHGQDRRGSRMSVRAPSRQPSMASLRPHSPNPSLGSRSGSHGSGSNASGNSARSAHGNSVAPATHSGNGHDHGGGHHERKGSSHHQHHQQHQHHYHPQHHEQQQEPLITNIIPNPAAENVTIEIVEPHK